MLPLEVWFVALAALPQGPPREGITGSWRDLLADDLAAWELDSSGEGPFSRVEVDGIPALRVEGTAVTREELADFHLRAEFRWGETAGRSAGIVYDGCVEVRIRDDPPGVGLVLLDRARGDLVERGSALRGPVGEWHRIEIERLGDEAILYLDGEVVARVMNLRSPGTGGEVPPPGGRLRIRCEGSQILFRRLEIRRLLRLGGGWEDAFERVSLRLDLAERARDWERALDVLGELRRMPAFEGRLLHADTGLELRGARLSALLGRPDEALDGIERAIEGGLHGADLLLREPAFADLRGDGGFQGLVRMARARSPEHFLLHLAPDHDRSSPAPLVVALHGRGGNPWAGRAAWRGAATHHGALLVAARGPVVEPGRRSADPRGHFAWDGEDPGGVDLVAARETVDEAIVFGSARAAVDDERIFLAGYGQGGTVALALLAEDPERFAGAIAIGATFEPPPGRSWGREAEGRDRRAWLVVGEHDPLLGGLAARVELVTRIGLLTRLVRVEGAGHEWPPDAVARQVEGLEFLLAGG